MISVTRKTHIPSVEDSSCCSVSSKWCFNPGACSRAVTSLSANLHLLLLAGVIVGGLVHHRRHVEIKGRRRRRRLLPFQALSAPRVLRRLRSVTPRPSEIDHRYQVAYAQNRGAGSRHHVQDLKLVARGGLAARHPKVPENNLRKKRQFKPDKHSQRRYAAYADE